MQRPLHPFRPLANDSPMPAICFGPLFCSSHTVTAPLTWPTANHKASPGDPTTLNPRLHTGSNPSTPRSLPDWAPSCHIAAPPGRGLWPDPVLCVGFWGPLPEAWVPGTGSWSTSALPDAAPTARYWPDAATHCRVARQHTAAEQKALLLDPPYSVLKHMRCCLEGNVFLNHVFSSEMRHSALIQLLA